MITQEIARGIEPIVQRMVDQEVARRMEPVYRRRIAADAARNEAEAEIMAAARAVAVLTDRLAQARFAGKGENAARKALFLANLKLATVMRRHGRMR
ncbi:MAG: hypothetical protein ABIF45_17555 [Pseudomonadota bacterium]